MDLIFVVFGAAGYAEVRISSEDGAVRITHGSPKWVALEGISFPTEGAAIPSLQRPDVEMLPRGGPARAGEFLFHYTGTDKALRYILPDARLRLSSFAGTNDPRETRDWLFTLACRAKEAPPGEALRISKDLSRAIKGLTRVACFCGNSPRGAALPELNGPFHARMWAQYADNHAGIALAFDRNKLL